MNKILSIALLCIAAPLSAFDGEITVLKAEVVDITSFENHPDKDEAIIGVRQPGIRLNLKYCQRLEGGSATVFEYDCRGAFQAGYQLPVLSDTNQVIAHPSPDYYEHTEHSRDNFVVQKISILIKKNRFDDPSFEGVGLHRHIVGLDQYYRESTNRYGPNDGGSFVGKGDIYVESELVLRNGEMAVKAEFIVAHYYHLSGSSKSSASTAITFRPNLKMANGSVVWDTVERDYYLSYRLGTFDRSSELLR